MGICASSAATTTPTTATLPVQHKILLIGTGDSGKSTIWRQLRILYGEGFDEKERRTHIPIIHELIIRYMYTLCKETDHYEPIRDPTLLLSKNFVVDSLGDMGHGYGYGSFHGNSNELVTAERIHHINALWHSAPIQTTFSARDRFHLSESAKYFFERIYDVVAENYLPTDTDICRIRAPTTGIVELHCQIGANTFKVVDVCVGARRRNRFWSCFENVSAVIFVAAISEYDQVLYVDASTNRLVESILLFDDAVNHTCFKNCAFVLFLNKKDILAEKLKRVRLDKYFTEYTGGSSACEWMLTKFLERCRDHERVIYSHITCAIDPNSVADAFMAVKDMCIARNLQGVSLA